MLEQWSYLSQIIGAIAVVASLIFVGVQLRQNTKAVRTATSQTHSAMYHAINTSVIEDSDFARIWRTGLLNPDALNPDERVRFIAFLSSIFRFYESSRVQFLRGQLDAEHWHTIERQASDYMTMPGVQSWWAYRRTWHSAPFQDWIEAMPKRAAATIYERPPVESPVTESATEAP
jgi:hypothetical protein